VADHRLYVGLRDAFAISRLYVNLMQDRGDLLGLAVLPVAAFLVLLP
jgi:hypothetical protein